MYLYITQDFVYLFNKDLKLTKKESSLWVKNLLTDDFIYWGDSANKYLQQKNYNVHLGYLIEKDQIVCKYAFLYYLTNFLENYNDLVLVLPAYISESSKSDIKNVISKLIKVNENLEEGIFLSMLGVQNNEMSIERRVTTKFYSDTKHVKYCMWGKKDLIDDIKQYFLNHYDLIINSTTCENIIESIENKISQALISGFNVMRKCNVEILFELLHIHNIYNNWYAKLLENI